MRFGTDAMQGAFQSLGQAGEEALRWRAAVGKISGRIMGRGFPAFTGGFTKAPFDVIGDSLVERPESCSTYFVIRMNLRRPASD